MDIFRKFIQLIKVDIPQRLVYGLVTAEREDKDGETCHYDSTKPEYKAVNDEMGKASDGQNIMPLREMHQLNAVGAGKSIDFDDSKKEIRMAFKVVDDSTWNKVIEKVLIGFSQGGRYVKRWSEDGKKYYTAAPGEVSLVDNPALSGAVIEYVKADGTVDNFITPSIARLSEEDVSRIAKALGSELSTQAEKKAADEAEAMRKRYATGAEMNKEQIEKCAKALGISVEEFTKQFEASELQKKSMAALHGHLQKALDHHMAHHEAMTKAHEAHTGHLEKCMKAAAAVVGDEKDTEKALKALVDGLSSNSEMVSIGKTADGVEVFRKKSDKDVKLEGLTAPSGDFIKKVDVEAMVKEAIEDFKKKLPKNDAADGIRIVPRDADFQKAVAEAGATPDAIIR